MAQRKPENEATLTHVLQLISRLSLEEQEELIQSMKLQWLRQELGQAENSLQQGKGLSAEEAFAQLRQRYSHGVAD